MAMFETLVQLFAAFAKIGFTSFGGTSTVSYTHLTLPTKRIV